MVRPSIWLSSLPGDSNDCSRLRQWRGMECMPCCGRWARSMLWPHASGSQVVAGGVRVRHAGSPVSHSAAGWDA
jgi:hypothetical protein